MNTEEAPAKAQVTRPSVNSKTTKLDLYSDFCRKLRHIKCLAKAEDKKFGLIQTST